MTPTMPLLRTRPSRLWPAVLQLGIHCRESPAGFRVSHNKGRIVRRSWCLACCQELDRTATT
jgi:hypothetical protein